MRRPRRPRFPVLPCNLCPVRPNVAVSKASLQARYGVRSYISATRRDQQQRTGPSPTGALTAGHGRGIRKVGVNNSPSDRPGLAFVSQVRGLLIRKVRPDRTLVLRLLVMVF
jgi:hypothetical protein